MLVEEWCVYQEVAGGHWSLIANYGTFQEAVECVKNEDNSRRNLRIIQTWMYI